MLTMSRLLKWFRINRDEIFGYGILSLIAIFLISAIVFVAYIELAPPSGPPNESGTHNRWVGDDHVPVVIVMDADNQVECSYAIPSGFRENQEGLNQFDCEGKEGQFYGGSK